MSHLLYVAYGSNLHPVRLGKRIASARLVGTARLGHFALRFHKLSHDGSGKCTPVAMSEGLYTAIYRIASDERRQLDRIEGLGIGYDECRLRLPTFGDCFMYVASTAAFDERLSPYSWYKELVLAGCRHLDFPEDYIARVESTPTSIDEDAARHRENMVIVESIENGT